MAEPLTHDPGAVRDLVRERYAAAARAAANADPVGDGCCGPAGCGPPAEGAAALAAIRGDSFGAHLYDPAERNALPDGAALASLGCGNPTAVAALRPGETVLDLGSGGGIDVLLAARRVGPEGLVYGLDMTDEMLALARASQRAAGVENVRWLRGQIEAIPLPDDSVDVVISNCVINLSPDKGRVLREVARVLRPGGRLGVTDVIADPDMDDATRRDMQGWTGCIAGALTRADYLALLAAAGLTDAELEETHRVHAHASSAIVRARKPPPLNRSVAGGRVGG